MTDTANLALPCIEGSQAQKHVTHNEALRLLDTLVQLAVLDRDLTAPPGSPAEGQRWIVKTGATGAWASHVDAIAAWQDGAWQFSTPRTGWLAYVIDESVLLAWNGIAWVDAIDALAPTALNNMTLLGVGTAADATNPLSAKLNNTLFAAKTVAEGGDGHLRYKLSKESAARTLSFLFQDNYSGRAEIGLIGDDDFHFKVSADGSAWHDGIVIAAGTGAVTFPNTTIAGGRELLSGNRIYYVRTDGSDSNNGLANTAGGAFLTIQKAIDTAASLDLGIYNVTIAVADGTYAGSITPKSLVGSGGISITGNVTTPANVLISVTGGHCVAAGGLRGTYTLSGLKLQANTAGYGAIIASQGSSINTGAIEFGAVGSGGIHVSATYGARVLLNSNYTISGGGGVHWYATTQGLIQAAGKTITLSGTPAFSSAFALASQSGGMVVNGNTFSGSATGSRYSVAVNAWIDTLGGGASYLPGNSAGSTATGGQYN